MAKEVIKKDGSRETFDSDKIKNAIAAAAMRADLTEERQNEVVEEAAAAVIQLADSKEEITTSELREKTLSELERLEPAVAEAWRGYDSEKKEE